ncbi:hypothetical protein [Mucilaginibacter sp.]|uniref:hypothetical protein n=1 Tax=Mucilaginibacter sp. TaxID=1882438 RepID=UPI00262465B0|nr:hypothetical protein [Mucilaginibacter sp.]MDB5030597.1 hypothetical protein [Mucilaginibacter sp.]
MEKIYITNQVKLEILNIGGLASTQPYNLNGFTPLFTLGYSNFPHCKILEDRLQSIAIQYNTGKLILPDSISEDLTVKQCIELVMM